MKYLDPKADLTFKKIFGNHPKRLISLLTTQEKSPMVWATSAQHMVFRCPVHGL